MASTYSPDLRLELQAAGENVDTWGDITNVNLGTLLEQAIAGVASVAMTDANYTLTTANGASDEARNAVVIMTGTLTTTRNVICPTSDKVYLVKNSTTGGQSIVFKTSAGTGVTIANGVTALVYCDATNVVAATGTLAYQDASGVAITGGTISGATITTPNTGLKVLDPDGSNTLSIVAGSNLSADRSFTILTGNASRNLTMSGNADISGTNTGDQTITLTSDVTGSGTGSFAATIAADAVTNAKLANMAQATFKGRAAAAGTGDPVDLTAAEASTILGLGTMATQAASAVAITGGSAAFTAPISVASTTATQLTLTQTDAGAAAGPIINVDRISASPAASDLLFFLYATGRDSGGAVTTYASQIATILDPTNLTEDGGWIWQTMINGTLTASMALGAGLTVGAMTPQGAGTINGVTLYENNTLLSTKYAVVASYPTMVSLEGLSLVSGDILYATGADTLARLPKGSDGQVLKLASGLPSWASGGGGVVVTRYTASGTHTKNSACQYAMLIGIGQGGGGSGGAGGAAGSNRGAGSGGGGAAYTIRYIQGSAIASSETVTIGSGSNGGAGGSSGVGTQGSNGANTTFGSLATFYGGGGGQASVAATSTRTGGGGASIAGAGGIGANAEFVGSGGAGGFCGGGAGGRTAAGADGGCAENGGGAGGGALNSTGTNGGSAIMGGCGGGAGGFITTGNVASNGGVGGLIGTYTAGGGGAAGTGGATQSNGTAGAAGSLWNQFAGGGGGGGGGGNTAGTGGNGGAGGVCGGGGGGGGGGTTTGGTGGNGGRGELIIVEFLG